MKRGSKIGMKGENLWVSNVRNNRFKNCGMNTEKKTFIKAYPRKIQAKSK